MLDVGKDRVDNLRGKIRRHDLNRSNNFTTELIINSTAEQLTYPVRRSKIKVA